MHFVFLSLIALRNDNTRRQRGLCVCRNHNVSDGPKMMHQVTPIQVVEQSFCEVRSHDVLQCRDLIIMPSKQLDVTLPRRS